MMKSKETPTTVATEMTIVKRDGRISPFQKERVAKAIEAAFRDTKKIAKGEELTPDIAQTIQEVTDNVAEEAALLASKNVTLTVEGIQDLVEVTLMKNDCHDVARDYIIYRDHHKALRDDSPRNLHIFRHDDKPPVRFNPIKIASSLEGAFRRHNKVEGTTPDEMVMTVNELTAKVVENAQIHAANGEELHLFHIQEYIEHALMGSGYFNEAKEYIIYRAEKNLLPPSAPSKPKKKDRKALESQLKNVITHACRKLDATDAKLLIESTVLNFYDEIKEHEVDAAMIMAAKAKIEIEPSYAKVASRLLLDVIYRETMNVHATNEDLEKVHQEYFFSYIDKGIEVDRLSPDLKGFDLERLSKAMKLERDDEFMYLGLQTIYDRYLIHHEDKRIETPQIFWMRVAMGLALREEKKNERAIEFYNVLSTFHFVSSTPTLFNSGTAHSQLSSCYLSTVMDDLSHIFKIVSDDAQLSKWAGGLGNDWTNVRATGSRIKGTNGRSQGIIPFLKVANDTAVAVNQGGKRKGAMCAYLETWHLDIEDFLELRKNTGDERRRTHDMNTANWIPDLFMKRVIEEKDWTLFSPSDTPDLHDLYGKAFEKRYTHYEKMAEEGKIKLTKKLPAVQLWRKMLSMLFETGHPWITFKDPSNIRSPQDHKGVVHSSNLCTEILLNTSKDETAVCNLGSVNLVKHVTKDGLDEKKLKETVRTALRMLDNVIDINFYPIPEAQNANARHRPIGMGIMGFQDALCIQDISYASHEAVAFADKSMEMISYYAIWSSTELAEERGTYETYKGSKWDRGLLPIDTIELVKMERGGHMEMDQSSTMPWEKVRARVKKFGMRNSNTMAIAPTATIANISDVTSGNEPFYKHLYAKSNLSGEFTVINNHLVNDLKARGLWDEEMLDDLKYFDGSLAEIERVPADLKQKYLTCFEIDPEWILECGSRRQKWIDMGQSLNLYLSEPSGKKLHEMYTRAWQKGLKTTYYLRSLGATQIEKSTTDINKRGLQPRWMKSESPSSRVEVKRQDKPIACSLEEGCESCQ